MTYHKTRRKPATGFKHGKSHRVIASIPADDFARLSWWAESKGKPLAWAIREAVYCYLVPIAGTADAALAKKKK